MLSRRLKAFVIPTSQSRPIAHARTSLPTISTLRPLASTTTPAVICAASFASGLRPRRSSTSPAAKTIVMPARIPAELAAPLDRADRRARGGSRRRSRAKIPTPPNVGVACSCQRSSDGMGDESRACGRAKQEPESRGRYRERRDRDDRIHSLERVIERPVAQDVLPARLRLRNRVPTIRRSSRELVPRSLTLAR